LPGLRLTKADEFTHGHESVALSMEVSQDGREGLSRFLRVKPIAVVEKDDVSGSDHPRDATGELLGVFDSPVIAVQGATDHGVPAFSGHLDQTLVVGQSRETQERGTETQRFGKELLATVKLTSQPGVGLTPEVGVAVGVAAYLMALGQNLAGQLRQAFYFTPDRKERGFGAVGPQETENRRGQAGAGTVIEGESHGLGLEGDGEEDPPPGSDARTSQAGLTCAGAGGQPEDEQDRRGGR
jgi:hypothetical protein